MIRRGQTFRRTSDGYVFRVESVSRVNRGAMLQCVDATMVFGWFTFDRIARDFVPCRSDATTMHVFHCQLPAVAS